MKGGGEISKARRKAIFSKKIIIKKFSFPS